MKPGGVRVHTTALALTTALLVLFVASTWLYGRHGREAVVLGVFEVNQTHRAEVSRGALKELHLADYLRVDPASIDMRGKLVDAMIGHGRANQAVETALAGLDHASPADEHLARLLIARARIAAGELGEAKAAVAGVLESHPSSAEALYRSAQLNAARGEFAAMRADFNRLADAGFEASTRQFAEARRAAEKTVDSTETSAPVDVALAFLMVGRIDQAFGILASTGDLADGAALFWRGVVEEESGRAGDAREFYRRSAAQKNPLAAAASARLPH